MDEVKLVKDWQEPHTLRRPVRRNFFLDRLTMVIFFGGNCFLSAVIPWGNRLVESTLETMWKDLPLRTTLIHLVRNRVSSLLDNRYFYLLRY